MCGGIDISVWSVCVEFLLNNVELFDLFYVFRVIMICEYSGFIVPPITHYNMSVKFFVEFVLNLFIHRSAVEFFAVINKFYKYRELG